MKKLSFIIVTIALFSIKAITQTNLCQNPNFEIPSTISANPQAYCNLKDNYGTASAAHAWGTWINNPGQNQCMFTELVKVGSNCIPYAPSKAVSGNMMHVYTTDGHMGIAFNPITPEYKSIKVSCWIYVVKGKVGIGAGNAGNTSTTGFTKNNCKWEYVETVNSVSPANNFCIYATYDVKGTEWYVDNVMITPIK